MCQEMLRKIDQKDVLCLPRSVNSITQKVESATADSIDDALNSFFDKTSSGGEIDANISFACQLTI